MKIVMLTYEIANQGGNFVRSLSLAKGLTNRHDVTLLAAPWRIQLVPKTYFIDKVKVVETISISPVKLRHNGLGILDTVYRCYYLLRHEFDLVHGFGHRPSVSIPGFIHKLVKKRPYLGDWSDLWGNGGIADELIGTFTPFRKFLDTNLENFVYSRTDGLTVISSYLNRKAKKLGQKNRLHLQIGIPEPKKTKAIKLKKLTYGKDTKIIGYVGNTSYDLNFLAEFFVELEKKLSNIKLIYIGEDQPHFKRRLEKNGLTDKLLFLGPIKHDQLHQYLLAANITVLPYLNKTINRARFPNKLGDYLAAGKTVVSHPTGDLKEFFKKYQIGLLLSENPKIFANSVAKLLTNKKQLAKFELNSKKIAQRITWETLSKDLEKFYSDFTKKS